MRFTNAKRKLAGRVHCIRRIKCILSAWQRLWKSVIVAAKKADGAAGEYAFCAISGTGRLYLTFDFDKDFLCTLDFPITPMSS